MQVEIKLRLPNKEAHDKVAEALKDAYIETHDQENFFYEGSEKELNKARVSLRTRFYGGDKKCVITMKVTVHSSIQRMVDRCYSNTLVCTRPAGSTSTQTLCSSC